MRLADHVDFVIGVDTHKNSHTLGLIDRSGAELDHTTLATDAFGYRKMLAWARQQTPDAERRCWAIEGTGSYGAGFTTYLLEQGEWVVERSIVPSDPPDATVPRATTLMRCEPLVRHWRATGSRSPADAGRVKRSACCSAPERVRCGPAAGLCATSKH
jgi:hypothetical protein